MECARCGTQTSSSFFLQTNNIFYKDGIIPICKNCIADLIGDAPDWNVVQKICQYFDIPFEPKKFEEIFAVQGRTSFPFYLDLYKNGKMDSIDWSSSQEKYRKLQIDGDLESEVPLLEEAKLKELRLKWGENYSPEELYYLEQLFRGILSTQNVNGVLPIDQALKLCKISLEIDSKIREDQDVDKILKSYDTLIKIANFTPKNSKNTNNLDSIGELGAYLEKTGFINKFYDGVKRDTVDITIDNIQQFNQRLYVNETGIAEDIEKRVEILKQAKELEDDESYDLIESQDGSFDDEIVKELESDNFEEDLDSIKDED